MQARARQGWKGREFLGQAVDEVASSQSEDVEIDLAHTLVRKLTGGGYSPHGDGWTYSASLDHLLAMLDGTAAFNEYLRDAHDYQRRL